ncbi:hypothetical protein EES42_30565 [Streptomyces sp. ADI95-17]|nr:hypothetical protein EES42_30565 [Streptomyces sp. ADI95-17]
MPSGVNTGCGCLGCRSAAVRARRVRAPVAMSTSTTSETCPAFCQPRPGAPSGPDVSTTARRPSRLMSQCQSRSPALTRRAGRPSGWSAYRPRGPASLSPYAHTRAPRSWNIQRSWPTASVPPSAAWSKTQRPSGARTGCRAQMRSGISREGPSWANVSHDSSYGLWAGWLANQSLVNSSSALPVDTEISRQVTGASRSSGCSITTTRSPAAVREHRFCRVCPGAAAYSRSGAARESRSRTWTAPLRTQATRSAARATSGQSSCSGPVVPGSASYRSRAVRSPSRQRTLVSPRAPVVGEYLVSTSRSPSAWNPLVCG